MCFATNGLAHTFHNGVARVALRGAGGLATAGGARKYSCGEFGRWGVLTGGKRMDGKDDGMELREVVKKKTWMFWLFFFLLGDFFP